LEEIWQEKKMQYYKQHTQISQREEKRTPWLSEAAIKVADERRIIKATGKDVKLVKKTKWQFPTSGKKRQGTIHH